MVSSKRTSSVVWCLLLAGLLLAAAEVEAGRVQKQEEEVGGKSSITDLADECYEKCKDYHWAELFECISKCRRANAAAGSVAMGLREDGAKNGIVSDQADCFRQKCLWLHGADQVKCMINCGKASAAAGSTEMTLREDGTGAGADGAILQVV